MARTVRTTISIPPELKARMNAVAEPVNWSAVACRAFEDELARITTRRGAKDMKDAVERLRASKRKLEDARYQQGFEAGKQWAIEAAEAEELERLADLHERCSRPGDWEAVFSSECSNHLGVAGGFLATIDPVRFDDDREWRSFWEAYAGEDHETLTSDDDYVRGFAEGALEVWEEVKDQI